MTKSSDFQQVLELFHKNFRGPDEPSLSEFPILLRRGIYRVFVLKKDDLSDGKNVAGVAITANWGISNAVHLEYVAISDACQGKGLGTILMQTLITRFRNEVLNLDKGAKMLTLECEKKLINFYSRLGFRTSPAKPRIWEIETNGKQIPHEYFLLGTTLSNIDIASRFLDNKNFVRPYRKILKNKSAQILNQLRKKSSSNR